MSCAYVLQPNRIGRYVSDEQRSGSAEALRYAGILSYHCFFETILYKRLVVGVIRRHQNYPTRSIRKWGRSNWLMQASLTNSPPKGTSFLMSVRVSGRLFIVFQHCRAILRYTSYTYSKLVPCLSTPLSVAVLCSLQTEPPRR